MYEALPPTRSPKASCRELPAPAALRPLHRPPESTALQRRDRGPLAAPGPRKLRAPLLLALLLALAAGSSRAQDCGCPDNDGVDPPLDPQVQVHPAGSTVADLTGYDWTLSIASWNIQCLSTNKVTTGTGSSRQGRKNLLAKYGSTLSGFDIVVIQELLGDGSALTEWIASRPELAGYTCDTLTDPAGRRGRQERYGLCYQQGGLLRHHRTFDYYNDAMTALDGSQQTAQNIWMRPAFAANFTYYPPRGGSPFNFDLYTIHTKPSYSCNGEPPPGTPQSDPRTKAVTNELTSLEQHLQTILDTTIAWQSSPNTVIVGDLNADCAYYPRTYDGKNFSGDWSWKIQRGEKTNAAPGSRCAYDRILLSDPVRRHYYIDHGIYSSGISYHGRVDGKRVSDHYLVWTLLGQRSTRKRKLCAVSNLVEAPFKRAHLSGVEMEIVGENLTPQEAVATLYAVPYSTGVDFNGGSYVSLADAALARTLQLDAQGSFSTTWTNPRPGVYSLVLDVNRDGWFHKDDGDLAIYANQADLIVLDAFPEHGDLVTLDGDGEVRKEFSADFDPDVYALGRNLPPGETLDAYLVSVKLASRSQRGDLDWDALRLLGRLDLEDIAIPVHRTTGLLDPDSVPAEDKVFQIEVSDEGTFFAAVWPQTHRLFNLALDTGGEVTLDPSIYDLYATDDGEDPCGEALESDDQDLKAVCNLGDQFPDYYGTEFNLIIDLDGDGYLGTSDPIDTYDVGDMTAFFAGNEILGAAATGDPAVGEYKQLLNAHLDLDPPLEADDQYDDATRNASSLFVCDPELTAEEFHLVEEQAQIGFRMVDGSEHVDGETLSHGLHAYDSVHFVGTTFDADHQAEPGDEDHGMVCLRHEDATYTDIVVTEDTDVIVSGATVKIDGTVEVQSSDPGLCLLAEQLVIQGGSLLFFSGWNPVGLFIATVDLALAYEAYDACASHLYN